MVQARTAERTARPARSETSRRTPADAAREATRKVVRSQVPAAGAGKPQFTAIASPFDVLAYQRDVLERAILFFDTRDYIGAREAELAARDGQQSRPRMMAAE